MSARLIPDGAGVTNHFSVSFGYGSLKEIGATEVDGLNDEHEIIDGPDGRGYATGKVTRQTLTVSIPAHDPAILGMHKWKDAVENGIPAAIAVSGVITKMDSGDRPIAIWELEHCLCHKVESSSMKLDGAEVDIDKFSISYHRAKRIGP